MAEGGFPAVSWRDKQDFRLTGCHGVMGVARRGRGAPQADIGTVCYYLNQEVDEISCASGAWPTNWQLTSAVESIKFSL